MKTKLAVLLALCMLLLAVTGCSQQEATPTTTPATVAPTEAATETVILPTDMAGKLVSFIGSKLTITSDQDANDYTFDVSNAEITAKNMVAGDEILVLFSGEFNGTDTSAVNVLKVEDLGGAPTEQEEKEVAGTLVYIGENTITIQLNDGTQLVFNSNNCEHHFKNGLQPGNWVSVTYIGELNGTDTSGVKALSITDDDANESIKEAQNTMNMDEVGETVYCSAAGGVNVRESYTTKSESLGVLAFGEAIQRIATSPNGWSKVIYNNQEAYIYSSYLSTSEPGEPVDNTHIAVRNETVYCNYANGVHVRESNTTKSEILGTLGFGESVQRIGICDNGWSQVTYKGKTGYISSSYLSTADPTDDDQNGIHISERDETVYCNNPSGVHVRESYSTKSSIIGSIAFGEAIHRTGICDNGWSRVTFRNRVAYISSAYLSTSEPSDPASAPAPAPAPAPSHSEKTISGSVVECSMNTISIAPDGYTHVYTLDVSDAEHRYANGIQTGNHITITYTGDLDDIGSVRVIRVVDTDSNAAATARYTGTVIGATMNTISIVTDDGAQMTFDKQDAQMNVNGITEGIRVHITADPSMSVPSSNILFASVVDPA